MYEQTSTKPKGAFMIIIVFINRRESFEHCKVMEYLEDNIFLYKVHANHEMEKYGESYRASRRLKQSSTT